MAVTAAVISAADPAATAAATPVAEPPSSARWPSACCDAGEVTRTETPAQPTPAVPRSRSRRHIPGRGTLLTTPILLVPRPPSLARRCRGVSVMRKLVFTAALALLATACGGGGGGGGGGGPWLTFSPSTIVAMVEQGQSGQAAVTATAHSVPDVYLNAGLIFDADAATVFQDWSVYASEDRMSYTLVLETRPGLAAGTYEGLIAVRVCQDDDPTVSCNRPYGGSPWHVPYRITVTPTT